MLNRTWLGLVIACGAMTVGCDDERAGEPPAPEPVPGGALVASFALSSEAPEDGIDSGLAIDDAAVARDGAIVLTGWRRGAVRVGDVDLAGDSPGQAFAAEIDVTGQLHWLVDVEADEARLARWRVVVAGDDALVFQPGRSEATLWRLGGDGELSADAAWAGDPDASLEDVVACDGATIVASRRDDVVTIDAQRDDGGGWTLSPEGALGDVSLGCDGAGRVYLAGSARGHVGLGGVRVGEIVDDFARSVLFRIAGGVVESGVVLGAGHEQHRVEQLVVLPAGGARARVSYRSFHFDREEVIGIDSTLQLMPARQAWSGSVAGVAASASRHYIAGWERGLTVRAYDDGEGLVWSRRFDGSEAALTHVLTLSDGNLLVLGKTERDAILADGEELIAAAGVFGVVLAP